MDWIIRNTKKLQYHTNLKELLNPISNELSQFNWFLSDLDFLTNSLQEIPINFDEDYFILNFEELELVINSGAQIVWGVISAIPKEDKAIFNLENLPYSEGNELIWKNGNLQIENSVIEIIAWDSSYTIIKFSDEALSNKFAGYFDEAIQLEKYKW